MQLPSMECRRVIQSSKSVPTMLTPFFFLHVQRHSRGQQVRYVGAEINTLHCREMVQQQFHWSAQGVEFTYSDSVEAQAHIYIFC